ncbi:MAG: leucine-rich repeat domain-containing protein, partial [Bacillales bacterium]|nr:leucine-rich repeat domain-containing protein [Bacillales bacterium]
MKKKTLLIVSTSFALGVGVIGSGVGALLHQKASAPGVMEDATLPSDEIGARVRLGAEGDATTDPTVAAPTFVNTLGYRLIDEESGAKSIRVYAVLNGYKGLNSASVTRKVEDSTGASVMKEKTIEFGYVYSSIKDAESVTWDDALPAETDTTKNYFVVFTLKNIPEAHWLDKLSVTFAVDNGAIVKSAEALANVKGLMEQEVGVGVTLAQAESGVIFAMKSHGAITEAVVPENYYKYEGHVATYVGKVTRLGDPDDNMHGAFENCSSLTSVTLPDTITEMGGWSFSSSSKLTAVRLPRDLANIYSSCWGGTYSPSSIKNIDW